MPKTVTYTGTLGAGMVATVQDYGSEGLEISASDGNGEWRDPRKRLVIGPANSYDAMIALNVSGLGYNSAHPWLTSPAILCGTVKLREPFTDKVTGAKGWIFNCGFSRPPSGIWGDPNPLNRPLLIGLSFSMYKIPSEIDGQGYVIQNSAGDIFDPPQTIDRLLAHVRVMQWVSSYTGATASALIGKVNASDVTLPNSVGTCSARTLKCVNYAPATDIILSAPYVPVLYEFEIKYDKYDRQLLDKGYQAWYNDHAGTNRKGKIAAFSNLEPIPNAILLDGTGTPILTDDKTILDLPNGFSYFATPTTSQLPAYLSAVQGADSNGGYYLPYRVEPEVDFTPFVTAGL